MSIGPDREDRLAMLDLLVFGLKWGPLGGLAVALWLLLLGGGR